MIYTGLILVFALLFGSSVSAIWPFDKNVRESPVGVNVSVQNSPSSVIFSRNV